MSLASYVELAEQKLMFLFVSLPERTSVSQERRLHRGRKGLETRKSWTAENGMKIRFYFCILNCL